MKNFNEYIFEKLHLNKEIKNNISSFKRGDIIFRFEINTYKENTFLQINKRNSLEILLFKKYNNNDNICFITDIEIIEDKFSYEQNKFINSNGYIEYNYLDRNKEDKYYIVYLNKDDGINFIQRLIDKEESIKEIISYYFDNDDDIKNEIKIVNENSSLKYFINRANGI